MLPDPVSVEGTEQVRVGGTVERSQGDSNPVLGRWIEEHRAPADSTKAATYLRRRVIPSDVLETWDLDCTPWHVAANPV